MKAIEFLSQKRVANTTGGEVRLNRRNRSRNISAAVYAIITMVCCRQLRSCRWDLLQLGRPTSLLTMSLGIFGGSLEICWHP